MVTVNHMNHDVAEVNGSDPPMLPGSFLYEKEPGYEAKGQLPSSSYNHNAPTTHNPQNICERVYNKLGSEGTTDISVVRVFSVL